MDADGFLRPLDARPDAGRSEGVRFGGPQAGPEALSLRMEDEKNMNRIELN